MSATEHPKPIETARELRRRSTEAEKKLWKELRSRQLSGFKFRRQQSFQSFVLDFVCLEARLVIEVDGGQHAIEKEKDAKRDARLRAQGFEVLRFWNHEVLGNIEGVTETIARWLRTSLPTQSQSDEGHSLSPK